MPVTRIAKTALLPYAAEQLFDLVNDIAAYPQYMDGCVAATVLLSTPEIVEARLELSRAGITQAFATRNRLQRPQSIDMELLEGPFTALSGRWQFLALAPEACKVSLDLRFELDGKLASLAAGKLFESVAVNLVDALCRRAHSQLGATA
ncbi:MAG: type II toxin-antitoxin system RatA family toxin [Cellvibrionales bacterium]|jgi:ribosome-associated toxin RatA of RatAB toxin-antitoxin module|nr:type II toxin-antitoxin system RatA family toxin [Cellvibrionales bacterium]MBK8676292.1 type II toxin-antitoxin system RatA family toxin [Cellvibrionales bacterium]HRG50924.1 type II toxin-antitoxin system RatA family toxin [Pseudomonadales bacterium]